MKHSSVAIPLSAFLLALTPGCFSDGGMDPLAGDDSGSGETDGGPDSDGSGGGSTGGADDSGADSGGGTSDGTGGGTTGGGSGETDGGGTGDLTAGGSTGGDDSGGTTGGTSGGSTGDDSGGSTGGGDTGGSTGGVMPDGVAPEVVSVSPEVSALGVPKDTNIVITFSEPMDEASVETAWSGGLLGIKTANVTFSWNGDSTVLTIDPNEDLVYAQGAAGTQAIHYTYALDLGVTDQSGEPMAQEFLGSFSTLRRILEHLSIVPALTGTITVDGNSQTVNKDVCNVGDDFKNRAVLCGVTFDLEQMDGDPQTIETATIDWRLAGSGHTGLPMEKLGGVQHWVIEYKDLASMESGALGDPNANMGMLYEAYLPIDAATDEVTAVSDEIQNGDGLLQFRLQIDGAWITVDETSDYWVLQSGNYPALHVQYLTP